MGSRAGDELKGRNRGLLIGGSLLLLINLARVLADEFDRADVVFAAVTLVVVPAVLWPIFRATRRRSTAASALGAWGSSSSLHIDQLRAIPLFAAALDRVRKTTFTQGWIGGGVVLDQMGITWTPTNYSQRRRLVPVLQVPWSNVTAVRALRSPGVGDPAVLEVQLADGSEWAMNVSGYRSLCEALPQLPVRVG